ncbi:MAG TPA: sulfate adenylyltransferase subunit CysD [Alphaproteobacteria bacterium]|nr:sulfate adenylyltransferase subunit CysD [Alphaproteobacteria bacterium]
MATAHLEAALKVANGNALSHTAWSHLDELESEAIHALREVAAEFKNPVLLFSGGKDSTVLLRLAEKAFRPGKFPFPLMHVDTGHNFPEVIEFRDRTVAQLGERLIVRTVQESIDKGRVKLKHANQSRNALQTVTLLDAIAEFGFDACIGGARRDEEKARAKERIFSFRDAFGQWDPRRQRPELWSLYNGRLDQGEHMRVFPLSNWTELDVWQYIARESLALPPLYYAHARPVAIRGDILLPVADMVDIQPTDRIETRVVRFRTVGDISCTLPVESDAIDVQAIIAETVKARVSERGATRLDDQASETAMEERKRAGYF